MLYEKLVDKLNEFLQSDCEGIFKDHYPESNGKISETLIELLVANGINQYMENEYNFDGGPGYESTFYVLSWIEKGKLNTIDWLEECF